MASALFPSQQTARSVFPFPFWPHTSQDRRQPPTPAAFLVSSVAEKTVAIAAAPVELYSQKYFVLCALGGATACGPTHTLVTPLDLVKCRKQIDPKIYKGNFDGWAKIYKTEGFRGIFTGWGPTFIGYSLQGTGKYGLYEIFKYYYSEAAGEEIAHKYRQWIWLGSSASAEFFADIMLCPLEALKVRMQTSLPPFARTAREGFAKMYAAEGLEGFYKGITPLWARQIPYTMMKFGSFEAIVEYIYASYLPKPKSEYNKFQQLGVSFIGGYAAGILCATISHPADVLVSKLNNAARVKGESTGQLTMKLIKQLGFMGLWTGLGTRIIMIGTLTALQWGIYDSFKVAFGLPTTGH